MQEQKESSSGIGVVAKDILARGGKRGSCSYFLVRVTVEKDMSHRDVVSREDIKLVEEF